MYRQAKGNQQIVLDRKRGYYRKAGEICSNQNLISGDATVNHCDTLNHTMTNVTSSMNQLDMPQNAPRNQLLEIVMPGISEILIAFMFIAIGTTIGGLSATAHLILRKRTL